MKSKKELNDFYNSLTLPEKCWLKTKVNQDDFLNHPSQYLIPTWIAANEEVLSKRVIKILMYIYEEKHIKYINDVKKEDLCSLERVGAGTWGNIEMTKSNYELIRRRAINENL